MTKSAADATPYRVIPEVMWRVDPLVVAARKLPGWIEFHRACATVKLYFDNIERVAGKRGEFRAVAFTIERKRDHAVSYLVAEGRGRTPIDALEAAYRAAGEKGFSPTGADEWLRLILNPVAAAAPQAVTEFDDLLGGDEPEDVDDLLG